MKALSLAAPGGLKQLRVRELPTPRIDSPDQVLVRVKAGALNHLDLFVADGLPGVNYSFPHVIGSDGAGTVHEVGSAVGEFRLGDRVMVNPTMSCGECPACGAGEEPLCTRLGVLGEHCSGTIAEYIVLPAGNLARIPGGMPWPEAAAFTLATLTAWRMLVTRARLEVGETVLIVGIGGGVALAALQIALLRGARTIVTSGSRTKLELARRIGADFTLQHHEDDVPAAVREITGGRGADVVVDNAGERSWQSSLRSLRRGGRLVVCGATTGPFVTLDLRRLFWHQWSLLGSTLGSRREYAEILDLAEKRRLWPIIDRVVPLDQSLAALERLQRGEQFGKLVIEVAP
jgi:NADPH:quinone reductase-like Zn-dependent oxidoreductase